MTAEWLAVACLGALGWFWWDSLKKRELAIRAARRTCEQTGVQLLDETVALRSLRLARDAQMRMQLYREFAFEYSDTGDNRLPGRIYVLGDLVQGVHLVVPKYP